VYVCAHSNSKTNDPKVFKPEMTLGYPTSGMTLGLEGQGQNVHIEDDHVAGMSYAL